MYKVNDVVYIRDDLVADCSYDKCFFVESMAQYKGRRAIITEIFNSMCTSKTRAHIDLDDGDWTWSFEMFEPFTTFKEFIRSISNGV